MSRLHKEQNQVHPHADPHENNYSNYTYYFAFTKMVLFPLLYGFLRSLRLTDQTI